LKVKKNQIFIKNAIVLLFRNNLVNIFFMRGIAGCDIIRLDLEGDEDSGLLLEQYVQSQKEKYFRRF